MNEAFTVNAYRGEVTAGLIEDRAQRRVAGLFKSCCTTLGEQDLCGQPERILCAHRDEDFFWFRKDASAR